MKTVASFFVLILLLVGSTSSARVMFDHGVRLGDSCDRTEREQVLIQYGDASGMACNGQSWVRMRFADVCWRFGSIDPQNNGRCLCADGGSFVDGAEIKCREI